jgi:HAMP domain-containing protein
LTTNGISQTTKTTLYHQHINLPGSSQQWILIVQEDITDFSQEFFLLISLILATTLLLILIFTLLWSGQMTRALEQLTQVAETFSKGEWMEQPITIKNQGEIGRLAQAMENMRSNMIKFFERRH